MPSTKVYVEPFFGAGSVFFHKSPKSKLNVLNDKDRLIVNFFKILRDRGDELIEKIRLTPYSRDEYGECCSLEVADELERARRTYVVIKQGMKHTTTGSPSEWSKGAIKQISSHTNRPTTIEALHNASEILVDTLWENKDVIDVLDFYGREGTLVYCDPPYLPETRTQSNVYSHEMSIEDHTTFLEKCLSSRAMIVISGYSNGLYSEMLSDWRVETKDIEVMGRRDLGEKRRKNTECIWMNFNKEKTQ